MRTDMKFEIMLMGGRSENSINLIIGFENTSSQKCTMEKDSSFMALLLQYIDYLLIRRQRRQIQRFLHSIITLNRFYCDIEQHRNNTKLLLNK